MNSNESKDTEKYFNPNEYATAWVNGTGFNLQNQELSDWIQQLQELGPAHSDYQTVLKKIKAQFSVGNLLEVCSLSRSDAFTAQALKILWEADMPAGEKALELIAYLKSPVYTIALEALTVYQECMPDISETDKTRLLNQFANHSETGIAAIEQEFKHWISQFPT